MERNSPDCRDVLPSSAPSCRIVQHAPCSPGISTRGAGNIIRLTGNRWDWKNGEAACFATFAQLLWRLGRKLSAGGTNQWEARCPTPPEAKHSGGVLWGMNGPPDRQEETCWTVFFGCLTNVCIIGSSPGTRSGDVNSRAATISSSGDACARRRISDVSPSQCGLWGAGRKRCLKRFRDTGGILSLPCRRSLRPMPRRRGRWTA